MKSTITTPEQHKADVVLKPIYYLLGEDPTDEELIDWSYACEAASIGLLATIKDKKKRDKACKARGSLMGRLIDAINDAFDRGDLVVEKPKTH